jgi:uncharacterized RmlC-like cupin family protein
MSERCVVVRAGDATEGITGVTYAAGISATSAGARGLCLHVASLPPGARARPRQHERHDSAAYVIDGEMVLWSGTRSNTGSSHGVATPSTSPAACRTFQMER